MRQKLIILGCAKKHGLTEADIRCAWNNAIAVRMRETDGPCHYAIAGPDKHQRLVEMLAVQQLDGSFVVYHAMKLTPKMAAELGLG